jgi:hypothetical protein
MRVGSAERMSAIWLRRLAVAPTTDRETTLDGGRRPSLEIFLEVTLWVV